ncbi:RNA 2',3'-cyclic phosphodiesterase [Pilimelia columellifera]|uniref:RNA 2',3'-cyclic phosphodiesterase n=1 Tax=Pilimelia columellifera subsp. columellifera TaxID=706583 RepID=A0ABN3MVB6_9ACTN
MPAAQGRDRAAPSGPAAEPAGPDRPARLFLALYPPPAAVTHLRRFVEGLAVGRAAAAGVNARLVPAWQWHLTVAFLGDVERDQLAVATGATHRAAVIWQAAAARASAESAPKLRIAGGGCFGRGRFIILWAGVAGDVGALHTLVRATRAQLRKTRLPSDRRPLRPHLTLARPGDRVDVRADLAALDGYQGPEWTIDELCLVRSELGPAPEHRVIARAPLSASG